MTTFDEVLEEVANQREAHEKYADQLRTDLREAVAAFRAALESGEPTEVAVPFPDYEPDEPTPVGRLLGFTHWTQIFAAAKPVYDALDIGDVDEAERLLGDDGPLANIMFAGEVELTGHSLS